MSNAVIDNLVSSPSYYDTVNVQVKGQAELEYVGRLRDSLRESHNHMSALDMLTARLLKKFVGANTPHKLATDKGGTQWSNAIVQDDGKVARPLNNLYLYATTLVPLLVMDNPLPEITSPAPDLRPGAWGLGRGLEQLYMEIAFDDVIRRSVYRCIFGLSVLRCSIASGGQGIMEGGSLRDNGQPFVESMGSERFRFDPRASNFEDCRWMGHLYTLPEAFFRESEMYSKQEQTPSDVLPKYMGKADPYERKVALFDAWLPEGNPLTGDPVIITIGADEGGSVIHRMAPYEGDERGPYEVMSITPIIDSVVPLPPANLWERMDEIVNAVARKTHEQVLRQKDVTLYDRAIAPEEVDSLKDSNDGEMIPTSDPTRYNQVSMGGANKDLLATLELFRQQSSEVARNIDQLSGAGTSGDPTATEVATLQANANVATEDMIRCVHKPVDRIGRKLMWYLFNDPFINLPMTKRNGQGDTLDITFTSDEIEGEFMDYNFKHRLYSMQRLTPEKKVGNWMTILNQVMMPMIQLAQAQGSAPNVTEIVNDIARMLQLDEMDRYWVAAEPPMEQQQAAQPIGQPPQKQGGGPRPGQQYGRPQPRPAVQTNINAGQAQSAPKQMAPAGQGV